MTAPFSLAEPAYKQISIFDFFEIEGNGDVKEETGSEEIPCKIYDWRSNESIEFRSMIRED